jgi:hypothetical protein
MRRGVTIRAAERAAGDRKGKEAASQTHSYPRRKAEELLLNSFRDSYAKWEREGLIKKRNR